MAAIAPSRPTSSPTPDAPERSRLVLVLATMCGLLLFLAGGAVAVITGVGATATPASDSVDAGFARDMSEHHTQAVTMAGVTRDRTTDAAVRTLAFDIETSQNQQVGMMQGWLQAWGLPVNSDQPRMAWMSDPMAMSMAAGGLMPGMATRAEVGELSTLSGTALDVRFLQLMIRHHQGGLAMARDGAAEGQTVAVRRLAQKIIDIQQVEIATMTVMLGERGGEPLPNP